MKAKVAVLTGWVVRRETRNAHSDELCRCSNDLATRPDESRSWEVMVIIHGKVDIRPVQLEMQF